MHNGGALSLFNRCQSPVELSQ